MKRSVKYGFLLAAAIVLSCGSFEVRGEETAFENSFASSLEAGRRPVLLRYIAEENGCSVTSEEQFKTASVADKSGKVLKTYTDIPFISGGPVVDSALLSSDFGWTACAHVPNTDLFDFEDDAAAAGAFTYMEKSGNKEFPFYVARCYGGWYFTEDTAEHEKKCPHNSTKSLMSVVKVTLSDGVPDYDFGKKEREDSPEPAEAQEGFASAVAGSLSDKDLKPVLLEYALRKSGFSHKYSKEGEKVYVYGEDGALLTSFRGVPALYGSMAVDAAALERAGIESALLPNTDLFDTEGEAVTAGWLEYYRQSENGSATFYVGNCYGGYYFSPSAGEHAKGCEHKYNASMFFEYPVEIENGRLLNGEYERAPEGDFAGYIRKNGEMTEERPAEAATKMVTLIHSEYAKQEGVQSIYFSYRDRVYRDYWEDVSNYDVSDYIFIPPEFPKQESYGDFNRAAAADLAKAALSLLSRDGSAKIWVGTPGITSNNYNHKSITAEASADFLMEVRRALGVKIWEENVVGIYVNQESVYPEDERAQIDRMKETVRLAKKNGGEKKVLWIPYYDLAENSAEVSGKIAEVARIPELFDYIIIQPGYFFFSAEGGAQNPEATSHLRPNLDAVSLGAENNYVSTALGEPVAGGKTSYAAIGFEMEPQASYFSNSRETRDESLDRYTQYLLAGARVKEKGPMAFYASGDPHCNMETLIYRFYEAEELDEKAVRKKLDASLSRFYDYVFETREKEKVFYEYARALYLAVPENTEEGFEKAYDPSVIIPEFYKHEKKWNIGCQADIGDISEYIANNGSLPDYFDENILSLLSR